MPLLRVGQLKPARKDSPNALARFMPMESLHSQTPPRTHISRPVQSQCSFFRTILIQANGNFKLSMELNLGAHMLELLLIYSRGVMALQSGLWSWSCSYHFNTIFIPYFISCDLH